MTSPEKSRTNIEIARALRVMALAEGDGIKSNTLYEAAERLEQQNGGGNVAGRGQKRRR